MMGSTNSCLLLCDRWAQCAPHKGACQLEWVCKIAKMCKTFLTFLRAKFLVACYLCSAEECVGLREPCIKAPGVNPE